MDVPPMQITAQQLAWKRFRFWVRWDTLLLNLLVPFTNKLNQHQLKYGDETPPTPEELKRWAGETGKTFLQLSVAETIQVASACAMINYGGEGAKAVAYQFDVAPRLKASHYSKFFSAVRLPVLTKLLGYGPAMQASTIDLEYDASLSASSRVVANVQQKLIPTAVQFFSSFVSSIYSYIIDPDTDTRTRKLLRVTLSNFIICVGTLVAQVVGSLVGHELQGSTAAFLLGDVCSSQFLQRMPPKVGTFVSGLIPDKKRVEARSAVEDPNTLTNVSLATE